MEEGIYKAIMEIKKATGKPPKRIELEGGEFLVKIYGVEVLATASQVGQFFLDGKVVVPGM